MKNKVNNTHIPLVLILRAAFIHGLGPVRVPAQFMSFKPSIWPHFMNFFRPNLVTCKVVRPDDLEG